METQKLLKLQVPNKINFLTCKWSALLFADFIKQLFGAFDIESEDAKMDQTNRCFWIYYNYLFKITSLIKTQYYPWGYLLNSLNKNNKSNLFWRISLNFNNWVNVHVLWILQSKDRTPTKSVFVQFVRRVLN